MVYGFVVEIHRSLSFFVNIKFKEEHFENIMKQTKLSSNCFSLRPMESELSGKKKQNKVQKKLRKRFSKTNRKQCLKLLTMAFCKNASDFSNRNKSNIISFFEQIVLFNVLTAV